MSVNLSPVGGVAAQFFNNDGVPLAGGLIYTYAAGTSTQATTYTNSSGSISHSNPIVLDSAGRVPTGEIWLTGGISYKFVLKDSAGTLLATYDNIVGINSNFVNYTASQEIQTATAGQTVFTLTTMAYQPGTNNLTVFVDGVNQYGPGATYAYTETSETVVTFASGLHVGASVKFTTAQSNTSYLGTAGQISFNGFKGQTGTVESLASDTGSDWIGYSASGTGNVPRSAQDKMRDFVSVKDFGALGNGTTNDTVAIAAAIAATPTNGTLYFPPGIYCANIFIWRSSISLIGAGSASTTIKLPNNCPSVTVPWEGGGTVTGLPNVIEIGQCALGNSAAVYTNVVVKGMTIDGNYSNNTAPTLDLFGHGMILTKASNCFIDDVIAQNCYLTGIDNVINSNYNTINATCKSCGQASISGAHYPNFDVNSSKYSTFNVTSVNGFYGARMLDNCWNNTMTARVSNPSFTGLVYNNQSVNYSYNNIINVSVYGGCTYGQGVSIGTNCLDSNITANVYGVTDIGVLVGGASGANETSGNTIIANTSNCGGAGFTDNAYASYNNYIINSRIDGRSGPSGTTFAVYIYGHNNIATVTIKEGASPQVRGLYLPAGSTKNQITNMMIDPNTVQEFNNLGTSNFVNWGQGIPSNIASATSITLPLYGSLFNITGTTQIDYINSVTTMPGRTATLIFAGAVTVSSISGNVRLAGGSNFVSTANDTLTLVSNGTYWFEVARSVN
jgi:Pectate lyase superfamily protein